MGEYFVATVADGAGGTLALVTGDRVHPLPGRPTMRELLADWDAGLARLDAELGRVGSGASIADTVFLPPVPEPQNLYMAGANYADHAREMRGLEPGAPVPKSAEGPFMFLKPTTTLVGHRAEVRLGAAKVDWEVELAAVIGRHAHRVPADRALDHVAGYTIVNDVSARDRFKRQHALEPPMTWDWFGQKGWDTSCPAGPWLVLARDVSPGDLALRMSVNGAIEQDSRTSEMIFSLEEQIAYLSAVVPLVPGDMISTGTCAGVGMGKGRFLSPGDVMVAEIEGIGRLENPVVAA
jgi:2,4-didehydro-3-deoxy-L-rhamnonate hydrolase